MADWFTDINNWLSTGTILGLPVVIFIIVVAGFILLLFLVVTRKTGLKPFKPRDFEKEYEHFLKTTLKHLGEKKNIKWFLNGTEKGVIKRLYIFNSKSPAAVVDAVAKTNKYNLITDQLFIFSYSPVGILGKMGLQTYIAMVDVRDVATLEPYFSINQKQNNFEPYTKHVFLFTKLGEKPAERFTEIDTIKQLLGGQINYLPKIQFHDTQLTGVISKMREEAEIQKERFKGQKEAAED